MSGLIDSGGCDVSVVIPTHGRTQLLKRSISSVLRQTHSNLEVIVVLDGEDEDTRRMVAAIPDPRVKMVMLAASVGGSEARNVGAHAASGRYIALLDDDDEWLPDKLLQQVALAHDCRARSFVVVSEYLYRMEGHPDEVWPGHLPRPGEALSEFLFSSRGGFQTSTYLCPRELFLRVPFTAGLKKHQDWDWFLRLAALPEFQLLIASEPLSIYWVPNKSRASVSGTTDWRFSQTWAKSRLRLMTRKAYGTFLVKICVRGAAIQGAGLQEMWHLFHELVEMGDPSPMILAEFLVSATVPEGLRLRLRSGVAWLRRVITPGKRGVVSIRTSEVLEQ